MIEERWLKMVPANNFGFIFHEGCILHLFRIIDWQQIHKNGSNFNTCWGHKPTNVNEYSHFIMNCCKLSDSFCDHFVEVLFCLWTVCCIRSRIMRKRNINLIYWTKNNKYKTEQKMSLEVWGILWLYKHTYFSNVFIVPALLLIVY